MNAITTVSSRVRSLQPQQKKSATCSITSSLTLLRQNDLSKLDVAKHYVERLSDETQINEEVKRTQREIGRFRGAGDAITGRTLGRIRLHVREAVDFV